jgi:hypothetical protein
MSVYRKGQIFHYDFFLDRRRYFGSTGFRTEEAARNYEATVKREILAGEDPPEERRPRVCSYIYILQGELTGLVKIGAAVNVDVRVSALQSNSPDELILLWSGPGTKQTEAWAHRLLASHRAHGEWFRPTDDVVAFVTLAQDEGIGAAIASMLKEKAAA